MSYMVKPLPLDLTLALFVYVYASVCVHAYVRCIYRVTRKKNLLKLFRIIIIVGNHDSTRQKIDCNTLRNWLHYFEPVLIINILLAILNHHV